MDIDPPRRWETVAAQERLYVLLNLDQGGVYPLPGDIQDFELVLSNPQRLAECCELYDTASLDQDAKYLLGKLIVASLDRFLIYDNPSEAEAAAAIACVESILRRDFVLHFHTIDYWRVPPEMLAHWAFLERSDQEVWRVTPMMRQIWADCFRPEYEVWRTEKIATAAAQLEAALASEEADNAA